MIFKVPVGTIFLAILVMRYLEYIRGISFYSIFIIGFITIILLIRLRLRHYVSLIILVTVSIYCTTMYKPGNQFLPEGKSFNKELYGIVHIKTIDGVSNKKKKSKSFIGNFIYLNVANKDLLNKEIIVVSGIKSNIRKGHFYYVKGILRSCVHPKTKQLFEIIEYEKVTETAKNSDIFFNNLKINTSILAFQKAFLFGDKSELSLHQKEIFKNSGTMHLFAVSGLHVGCLFFSIHLLFKFLSFSQNSRIICTMIILYGYLYLVEFSVSSTRAYLMILIWSFFRMFGIKSTPFTLVCTTGVVLLTINPYNVISIGFILSISVVLSIIWLIDNTDIFREKNLIAKVFQICIVNYAAFWGSFIVLAKVFGLIVPVSLLSNLILIPIVSILMPYSFVGLFFLQFSFFSFLVPLFEWPLFQIIRICSWFSEFYWSTLSFNGESHTQDFGMFLIIIFFITTFGIFKNIYVKLLLLPIFFITILLI